MPEVKPINKLGRLVSYKIAQFTMLGSPVITDKIWKSIESSFLKENRYVRNSHINAIQDNYEHAMWAYYEFLESRVLNELSVLKDEVYRQIKTSEVKRNFNLQ